MVRARQSVVFLFSNHNTKVHVFLVGGGGGGGLRVFQHDDISSFTGRYGTRYMYIGAPVATTFIYGIIVPAFR